MMATNDPWWVAGADPNDPWTDTCPTCGAPLADEAGPAAPARTRRRPGRKPKLTAKQEQEIRRLYERGTRTAAELAARYGVGISTLYRILDRGPS